MKAIRVIARPPALRLAAAIVALPLLVAACGGNSPSPGVANLSSSSSSSTPSSTSSAAGSGAGGSSGSSSPNSQAVAYAACMRAHGVPNFPDPQVSSSGSEVKVAVRVTPGIKGNPHFKSAQQACRQLLPGGGPGSDPQLSTAEQAQVLQLVACIRKHGEPNLPDPTFTGGGAHLPPSVDTQSAAFKSAEQACQSLIPASLRGHGS
jgi:hypothetical protein